jgi:hypothetical protein
MEIIEVLKAIGQIAGIAVIPMFRWVVLAERRLSMIEGYCKGRNCDADKNG